MDYFKVILKHENHFCVNPCDVFDCLDRYFDTFTAIEASSWCELACIGDVYEDYYNRFSIEYVGGEEDESRVHY